MLLDIGKRLAHLILNLDAPRKTFVNAARQGLRIIWFY